MMLKALTIEALRSLWSTKQRTLLALIGIVIGIGSVIAMVSVGTIVQHEALQQFQEMGTDILTVSKGSDGSGSELKGFTYQDCVQVPDYCPDVRITAPYMSLYNTLKTDGLRIDAPALGVTESFQNVNGITVRQGRFISDLDVHMYYCVVGAEVAEKFRAIGLTDPVGHKILFADKVFIIIGVIDAVTPSNMRPYAINSGLLIPVTTGIRLTGNPGMESLIGRLTAHGDDRRAASQITHYFKVKSDLNVRIETARQLIEGMQRQMQLFTLLLGAIGSISLIVGGVGVMNVMLVSVSERKREIGIRRALGAQQLDIQGQFLVEAIILCIMGGMAGILIGIGASFAISQLSGWDFLISRTAVMLGVVVSCSVGLFFGFYPARQAAGMSPIEALRAD